MTTLFDECIEALYPDVEVIPLQQRNDYTRLMTNNYPIAINGRIDWEKVEQKQNVDSPKQVVGMVKEKVLIDDFDILIIWDGAHLPVIKSKLMKAIDVIDDVTAVGFDTWFYCIEHNCVIEFYHEGEITVGF